MLREEINRFWHIQGNSSCQYSENSLISLPLLYKSSQTSSLFNLLPIIIIYFHLLQNIPTVRDSSLAKNKLLIPINSVFYFACIEELLEVCSIKRMARPNIKLHFFCCSTHSFVLSNAFA